jgi:outer membrane protein TolC
MKASRLTVGSSVLLAIGCTVGPDYHRPELGLPQSYRAAPATSAQGSVADIAWWKLFGDPQLISLIEEALRDNLDLAVAAAQILQAEAGVEAARSPLFPQLSAQGQAARGNDILSGLEKVPVCVAYDVHGKRHDEIPMTQTDFHHAVPVYEYLDGWWEDISQAREFSDLPKNAQAYVRAVEGLIGAPVCAVGVGPRRDQTVQLREVL